MPSCLLWLLVVAAPELDPAAVSRLTALAAPAALSDDPTAREALRRAAEQAGIDWLTEAAASDNRAERVRAWEKLLSWEATLAPPATGPSRAEVDAALADVLADARYAPAAGRSWVEPWLPYVERLLDLLFAPFMHSGQVSRGRQAAAVALCGLTALALAAAALRLARRRARRGEPGMATASRRRRPAVDLRAAAAGAAEAGDYRRALALLYLALLGQLDATGRLPLDVSRTNRENAAAAPGALAGPLAELGAVLDAVAYGGERLDREAYDRCAATAGEIWSAE